MTSDVVFFFYIIKTLDKEVHIIINIHTIYAIHRIKNKSVKNM